MSSHIEALTTADMARLSQAPDAQVIDVRPVAAYNGWPLAGESRGGHVPRARSLPLAWARFIDWIEVLDQKGIQPDRPVIVYGYDIDEARQMAGKLIELGYDEVAVYAHFFDEWLADPQRPVERLPRYEQLVYPGWVDQLLHEGRPPRDLDKVVICHAHFDHEADYDIGHIPTAVSLNTNWLESTTTWDRRSPEELKAALLSLGIRCDTTVVLYGRFSFPRREDKWPAQSAGHLGAMRCAAIMLYAGVRDVRILDGGLNTWEAEGFPLSCVRTETHPVDSFGCDIPAHPEYMIDTPEAKVLLDSSDGDLVCVRSWEEFIGNVSGYNYIEKKGRIPGAVFGDCGSDAYHMENYRNLDHTMREHREVAERWAASGIVPERRIAFYCGTGWRGSEAFMNAYLMGWNNIAVYDGGWFGWSNDPANPIETGIPRAHSEAAG